jgi:hypothetical protein
MVETIAAAMLANKQLQKGISPGVRASGPFAKQISQANKSALKAGMGVAGKAMAAQNQASKSAMRNSSLSAAGKVAGKALGGMGSKFGK